MHVIASGNLADGHSFHGPFEDPEDGTAWAEDNCDGDWWLIDVVEPGAAQWHTIKSIKLTDLNSTHVLVGDAGGRSVVENVEPSSAMPGLYAVETEHGTLYLDPDLKVKVLYE